MTSSALSKYGFHQWHPFSLRSISTLIKELPTSFGVYAIRRKGTAADASSDIVYIGSATNKLGILQRIRQYLWPGPTQRTNQRIRALIADSTAYELSWVTTREQEDALVLEAEILRAFVSATGALPVLNRQMPRTPLAASSLTGVHLIPEGNFDRSTRMQVEEEVFDWLRQEDEAMSDLDKEAGEEELALIDEWDPADEGTEVDDYDEEGAEREKDDQQDEDD